MPELRRVEGDRDVGARGDALDLAGGAVDARRDVGGHDRRAAAVHRLDRLLGGRAGRAVEAGAEDRVDDAARALERGRQLARLDLAARARPAGAWFSAASSESSSAGQRRSVSTSKPVSARSRAATSPSPPLLPLPQTTRIGPGLRDVAHRLCERLARGLHQLKRGNAALVDRLGVGGTHALGVVKRIQPVGKGHRPQRRGVRHRARCQAPCLAPGVLAGAWAGDDDRRGQLA